VYSQIQSWEVKFMQSLFAIVPFVSAIALSLILIDHSRANPVEVETDAGVLPSSSPSKRST